jgi:oligopeptide/dipeptide ABC transporter ATP-binding protein
MYVGRIVEVAPTTRLYARPRHPYTEALLAAVPKADPLLRDQATAPRGEVADPANPPPGCAFHPRCPHAVDRCRVEIPALREVSPGTLSACHRAEELTLAGVA